MGNGGVGPEMGTTIGGMGGGCRDRIFRKLWLYFSQAKIQWPSRDMSTNIFRKCDLIWMGWVDFLSKYQASNWASRWSRTDCLTPGRAQSKMFFTLDKSKPYKESPWLPSYGIYGLLRRSRIASKMYPLFSIGSEIDEVCEHIYDYFKNQAKAKDLKFLAFFHLFLF